MYSARIGGLLHVKKGWFWRYCTASVSCVCSSAA